MTLRDAFSAALSPKCNTVITDCPRQKAHKEQGKRTQIPIPMQENFSLQISVSKEKDFFSNTVSLGVPTILQGTESKCSWPKTLNLKKMTSSVLWRIVTVSLLLVRLLPHLIFLSLPWLRFVQEKLANVKSLSKNERLHLLPRFFYIVHRSGILEGQLRWADIIMIHWFFLVTLSMVALTYNLFN